MYKQVQAQTDLASRWIQIKQSFYNPLLWAACMLVLVNWSIEARKWQIQLKPLERMNFLTAFKSVLAGCSITMLTPYRVGEYGGRILFVNEDHRLDAIPLNILGSVSQLFVTIIMGTGGLLYLKFVQHDEHIFSFLPSYSVNILLGLSITVAFILLLVYLRVSLLVKLFSRIPSLSKFVTHIILLNTFSRKQLLRILFLSFVRYAVFILQYILLLQSMQVQINIFTCYWLITVFYLLMAFAPTIGFTELPLRASASVALLQLYTTNTIGIQAASLGIFFINLVVPAIVGSIFILGIKILKEK